MNEIDLKSVEKIDYKEVLFTPDGQSGKIPDRAGILQDIEMLIYLFNTAYAGKDFFQTDNIDYENKIKMLKNYPDRADNTEIDPGSFFDFALQIGHELIL